MLGACGGGGGSDESQTPNNPGGGQAAACFDSYSASDPGAEPYRTNRGQVIYTENRQGSVSSLDLASLQTGLITNEAEGSRPSSASPSNSGDYIAYVRGGTTGASIASLVVEDVRTGATTDVFTAPGFTLGVVDWSPADGGFSTYTGLVQVLAYGDPFGNIELESLFMGAPSVTWARDESRLAISGQETVAVFTTTPLEKTYELSVDELPNNTDNIEAVSLSPDGNHLLVRTSVVFANRGLNDYVLVNLATGQQNLLLSAVNGSGGIPDFAWSPTGQYLALAVGEGERSVLYMYSLQQATLREVSRTGEQRIDMLWAPGADRLLFVQWEPDQVRNLMLLDDPNATTTRHIDTGKDIPNMAWSPNSRYFAYLAEREEFARELMTGDALADCTIKIADIRAHVPTLGWSPWSPSGQFLLFPLINTESYAVGRPDGTETLSLVDLIFNSDDFDSIDVRWTSESDTLFFVRRMGAAAGHSIHFVEIDSLSTYHIDLASSYGSESVWFRSALE